MDIWGPLFVPSILGFRYFLTFVDDKSRFTWLYFLKLMSEASRYIQSFVSMIKTQYNINVKCIRSDNGSKFLVKIFFNEHGIIHQCSCVSTPQQNGIVERKHQHILGTARALLFQSKLPHIFWAHAVGHVVHIINKLPTPFLPNKSPYQVLHNCLPDIDSLRVFGSLCYATTLQHNRRKLDSRSRKCVYLGFRVGVKGHTLFDLQSREIFISKDVVFFEHIFPYHSQNTQSDASTSPVQPHDMSLFDDITLPASTHNHLTNSTPNSLNNNNSSH
jgi:transposase InsO family protein